MDSSKIKEYGNIEFKRIFNLLNEELNYKYKISFYNLLYGDLIKISGIFCKFFIVNIDFLMNSFYFSICTEK
jgi:hypothetical protein